MGKYKNAEDRSAGHDLFLRRKDASKKEAAKKEIDIEHLPLAINFGIHADLYAMEEKTGMKKSILINFSNGRMAAKPDQARAIFAAAKSVGWDVPVVTAP